MKKLILFTLILFPLFCNAQAKDKTLLLGVRGGISNGITFKKVISRVLVSETMLTTRFKGLTLSTLIEGRHRVEHSNLYVFAGGGLQVSSIPGNEVSWYKDEKHHTTPGLVMIFGVEYFLKKIPINISLDNKPSFNIVNKKIKFIDGAAFSLRYCF